MVEATDECGVRRVVGLLLAGILTAQAAEPATYLASNGAQVSAPDIASLNCPQMVQVLRALDQTQYRAAAPLTPGDPDWLIFEYEDQLASAYYTRCTVGDNRVVDPSDAFSRGFGPQ